ncbi:Intradiol ring-cleavage dioxygenase, partial [Tricladium varicosporioides]
LSECQNSPQALALRERSAARRAAKVKELRVKRQLTTGKFHRKRGLTSLEYWSTQNHNMSSSGYTLNTPEATIFGSNNTCELVPETTIGPYYVTGEYVRSNITEGQAGFPMLIEMQSVDMNTCAFVSDLLADIWNCNSTGFYSGIETSEGEGGLNSTFLRGIQAADEEGAVSFDTLFPGNYDSRVAHLHLV